MSTAAQRVLLVLVPLAVTAFELSIVIGRHTLGLDFRGWYWQAGHRVLEGVSPYAGGEAGHALNYPAFGALLFAPLGALPRDAATIVFVLLVAGSLPVSLRLLGVRDWRVYAAVLLWQPVMVGWETANVSLLIVCGLAVIWRHRDRPAIAGVVLALLVSVKFFVAPVGLWLLLTRRFRAAAWAVAATVLLNLVSWAILGFDQVSVYVHVLGQFAGAAQLWGYSLIGLMRHLGAAEPVADAVGVLAAGAVIAGALRVARERRDRVLFGAAIGACILASPIVETHYLTLILVPLALAAPRLRAAWLMPILLILTPADHPAIWQHAFSLVISSGVLLWSLFGYPPALRRSYSEELPSPAT